ncbi:MAG: sigma-E processing peptidase SpoIIGA [Ethanoligenens sp.]|uniref:sigma-E processing peptidase SpoIIGA n=1 Tax=Ethanoligenens sp. TaxID=2099655 RepID=UPI0039E7FE0F
MFRGDAMVRVVYIDVLFAVNIILDYFILLTVSRMLHRQDKRLRLLAGAAVGAIYALFIFLPEMGVLYTAGLKALLSVGIVLAAYRVSALKSFFQLLGLFYLVSFLFGGLIFALYLFCTPPGMLMRNGVVYFDISPVTLILAAGACYVLITLFSRVVRRRESRFYSLALTVDGKTISVSAMLDTGNSLCDPLSGTPVLVAEYEAVQMLLPKTLRPMFQKGLLQTLPELDGTGWENRLRMVPYGGLNGKGGLLPAFRPDELAVKVKNGTVKTKDVFIAVCGGRLSSDGRYRALLTPMLFNKLSGDDLFAGDAQPVPVGHAPVHGRDT